jgi:hypothetical protein
MLHHLWQSRQRRQIRKRQPDRDAGGCTDARQFPESVGHAPPFLLRPERHDLGQDASSAAAPMPFKMRSYA